MHTVGHRRSTPLTARALTAVLTAALLLLGPAGAAHAAEARGVTDESQVVLSGRVDVAPDETVRDVVVMHGSVTVDGTVDGSAIVLDGPVAIAIAVAPFLEGLLWFAGTAFGLGALCAAAWSARQTPAAPTIPAAGAPA
jgi:hypothetical protein